MKRLTHGDGINYWSINGKNYNKAFARLAAIEYIFCGENGKEYDIEQLRKLKEERDDALTLLHSYRHICGETSPGRIQELVEADREDAIHIGACGFCEYYQMDKFCCCPDWVEDGYAIIRKPKDYCTKFKKAGWVDEVWGENGCPSCLGYKPEKAEQEGRT